MGEDTDKLSSDIAHTRNDLSSHLDELQDKVSPAAIVERRKVAARDSVGTVRDKVMGSAGGAKDSVSDQSSNATDTAKEQFQGAPLAAGIAAFGLGMVVAALVPATKAEARAAVQVKDTLQEQAQPLIEDAKVAAADVAQQVKENATEAADQVKQTGQDAASRVQDEGSSAAESVRSDAPG